jgi:hypothetical protein
MKPDSWAEQVILDKQITRDEFKSIDRLADDPDFAMFIATSGFDAALMKWIRSEYRAEVLTRCEAWKALLDIFHRATIRKRGFLQPFGYMLGMTLAQQYGFSSELLDFTSDVRVAAFFATHDGPHYQFEGLNLVERVGTDIGVIYRLPSTAGETRYDRIDSRNYYTSPGQIHLADLCMRFEDKSSPEMSEQWVPEQDSNEMASGLNLALPVRFVSAMLTEMDLQDGPLPLETLVDRYLALYYQNNIRFYRLLDLEAGSFARSRLGRQHAVVIIPDELRREESDQHGSYATFQAIEDVSQRSGFECVYFRHSEQPSDLDGINREYLWPSDGDIFRSIISRVLAPSTEQYWFDGLPIPKRLDLVSPGYQEPRPAT